VSVEKLKYTKEHEWVRIEGEFAVVGITDYAQGELGDVVFVELPPAGTKVTQMSPFGTIEAVKTVADLFAPVTGEVIETNPRIESDPGIINNDPYGEGWLIKIRMSDAGEVNTLLSYHDYVPLTKGH